MRIEINDEFDHETIINNQNKEKKARSFVFITILVFFSETLLSPLLNDLSIYIQSTIDLSEWCNFLEHLAYFETFAARILLLIIVVHYKDVFYGLCFICITEFGKFTQYVLKLVYLSDKPYWVDSNLRPCSCFINYGNPSSSALGTFLMFSIFYKFCKSKNKIINGIFLFIVICLIIITPFSRFLQNAQTIDQILFGYGIGYLIYFSIFEMNQFDLDFYKQTVRIILSQLTQRILSFFILLYLLFNISNYLIETGNDRTWIDIITKFCLDNPTNNFDDDSLNKSFSIFIVVTSFLSVYIDYSVINKSDDLYFFGNNFENFRWNDTSLFYTFIRIVFTYLGFLQILSFFNRFNSLSIYSIIIRNLILNCFIGFYVFLFSKEISIYFSLGNRKYERANRSSILSFNQKYSI